MANDEAFFELAQGLALRVVREVPATADADRNGLWTGAFAGRRF